MHLYRQSILLFGLILPVVATVAIIGGGLFLGEKLKTSFSEKQQKYKIYDRERIAGLEIEGQLNKQKPHLDRWLNQLSQETASTATTNIREIIDTLPSKEIQLTDFAQMNNKAGFGMVSGQQSSQLRLAFRGSFRTVQRAFFELETRMPQLQLQDLQISPSTGQSSSLLNFQVTYTAWEK